MNGNLRYAAMLLLAVLLIAPAAVMAQDGGDEAATDSERELAREYLKITHQLADAKEMALAVGSQIIRQRPQMRLDIEEAAEAVAPKFQEEVDKMNEEVVAVYARRFTEEELQQMVDFETEFRQSAAGKKMEQMNDELAEEMGEISRTRGVAMGSEMYKSLIDELSAREEPVDAPSGGGDAGRARPGQE